MRYAVLTVLRLTLSATALAQGICQFPETIFGVSPGDQLGCSVAAGADVAAFGANMANGGTGSLTLRQGGNLVQTLLAGDGAPGDQFGYAASLDGDLLAVGAPTADLPAGRDAGAVYVFRKSNSRWSQEAKLTAGDGSSGAQFGFSVALQGNTLVVGAPMDSSRGSLSGAVYVFERTGSGWSQQAKLAGSQAKPFDELGLAVALDGGTLVAGAPFADGRAGGNQGAAYVFTGSGSHWTESQVLTAAAAAAGDEFGFAVALSGGTLAVGARRGDVAGSADAGWVVIFKGGDGGWQENTRLTAGNAAQAGALFGGAVALDGAPGSQKLLVGAARAHGGSGAAFLFKEAAGGGWQLQEALGPGADPQGRFGFSVAMQGGDAVVGAFMAQGGKGTATVCGQARLTLTATQPIGGCDTVRFTLTTANLGITAEEGVRIRISAPSGFTPIPADPRCGSDSGGMVCTLDRVPPAGTPEALPISFGVPECYGRANPVKFQAVVESGSSPPASISVPVVCKADLAVEKTGPASVAPGDSLPYSLKVTNLGPDPACGVSLRDPFPPGLGSPSAPCCLVHSNEVQFLKDKLSPGESSTVAMVFTVPPAAACGSQIVNTASATATTPDRQTRNNSATVTTTVTCSPLPPPPPIPALQPAGLAVLALLLACIALLRLRRRSV